MPDLFFLSISDFDQVAVRIFYKIDDVRISFDFNDRNFLTLECLCKSFPVNNTIPPMVETCISAAMFQKAERYRLEKLELHIP